MRFLLAALALGCAPDDDAFTFAQPPSFSTPEVVPTPAPMSYDPVLPEVAGQGCSFTQGGWGQGCSGENVGCLRDDWFDAVYPDSLTVGTHTPHVLADAAAVEAFLPSTGPTKRCPDCTFLGQLTAARLNADFSDHGVFGAGSHLSDATLTTGSYAGFTVRALIDLAESVDPTDAASELTDALSWVNDGFHGCDPAALPPEEPDDPEPDDDDDDDGVPDPADCEPTDPRIGALLYEATFDTDGALVTTPTLTDPWTYESGWLSVSAGGQQAVLYTPNEWTDTVTWTTVKANDAETGCDTCGATDRFRAGILARARIDEDQGEGFHGYRCAVAHNADEDCFDPGPFVQLAAFLDAAEDDLSFECGETCDNPTFDQLDRQERSPHTAVLAGDEAHLELWAVGSSLTCTFTGTDGEVVTAEATDDRFGAGTTGLSVLDALASYDHLRVCEALSGP